MRGRKTRGKETEQAQLTVFPREFFDVSANGCVRESGKTIEAQIDPDALTCGRYRYSARVASEGVDVASTGVEENVAGPVAGVGAARNLNVAGTPGRSRLERHRSAGSLVGIARRDCDLARLCIGDEHLPRPEFDAARTSILVF